MVAQQQLDQERLEALGPAERIVQALTTFTDHIYHGRPGMVTKDARFNTGVRWENVTWKLEGEDPQKVVYRVTKDGKKITKTRVGVLDEDSMNVRDAGQVVGKFRSPGLFPEAAAYLYKQVAEAYKCDNEFVARWASWQFCQDNKDLKVILAAFLLVQERSGQPVKEDGEVLFFDEDYRDVGEAMCLITDAGYLDAKQMLRIGDVLQLDSIAEINREHGFGKSARNPMMGRYRLAVTKWLRYRETNPKMLKGLVKGGQRNKVIRLAQRSLYKPSTPAFFEILRWKQKQAKDGRRTILNVNVAEAESWEGMNEQAICERIIENKPNYKRLVGLLPTNMGLTRAMMAAAIEAGSLSDTDLIILTPTLEELGLLTVPDIQARWKAACDKAENQRAANIAKNVKSKAVREGLQDAADKAVVKALEEVTKDLRVYVIVDKSGSMALCIERAKLYLSKFLQGFPLDRLHVSIFNTIGSEILIKSPKAVAVEHAFKGHRAGGGTSYAQGVRALHHRKPLPGEDVLMIFVGDQEDGNAPGLIASIRESGFNPVAFGLLEIRDMGYFYQGEIVEIVARYLDIPCFKVDEHMFDDPYAVTRILTNLIANTPVGKAVAKTQPRAARVQLVEQIMKTPLLQKPLFC